MHKEKQLLQEVNGKESVNKHDPFIYKCLEIRSNNSLVWHKLIYLLLNIVYLTTRAVRQQTVLLLPLNGNYMNNESQEAFTSDKDNIGSKKCQTSYYTSVSQASYTGY